MTKSRAILHLTGMTCKKYGSLERYLVELARECSRAGYRSHLQYESLPTPSSYLADLEQAGATAFELRCGPAALPSLRVLLRLMRQVSPEIVHCHFVEGYPKLWAPLIARSLGVRKVISMVHNQPPYSNRHPAKFGHQLYTDVLAVSDAVREALLVGGVDPRKIRTHYLGVLGVGPPSAALRCSWRERLCIPSDATALACVAFDAPFKGLDILLEAFQEVVKRQAGVHLIQIGVDPTKSTLPEFARGLGVSERVHWAGIVDAGWQVLNAADVYVQPSRAAEGLPLAIMEAMAMRLPVVCTRVSGNIEAVVDHESGLVSDPNPLSLGQVLSQILAARGSWSEMGNVGYQRYQRLFSGHLSVKKLVRDYGLVCS